jgi:hypothetical protein
LNAWYQVLRISADSPDSISCGRDHYVNWKREQQPGLGCDRGDYGQHNREHEQNLEFERKLNGEHGFDDRGTDESRD